MPEDRRAALQHEDGTIVAPEHLEVILAAAQVEADIIVAEELADATFVPVEAKHEDG